MLQGVQLPCGEKHREVACFWAAIDVNQGAYLGRLSSCVRVLKPCHCADDRVMETTMTDHRKFKVALLKRLSELDKRLHAIEEELDTPHTKDWEDAAVEHEGDEVLEGLGVSGQEEIRRIQAALERMREGEYGFCVKCGEEIAVARLEVVPEAPLCSACAAG